MPMQTIHYVNQCEIDMLSPLCIIDSSLILIAWILFVLQIITFIQMTCFFRSLKFENMVVFIGILYSQVIIAAVFTKYEFLLEIGFGLHIVILSYIIRRFLHLSTSLLKRTLFPTLGQKIVFFLINIGNFVLFSLSIDIALIKEINYFSNLIELVYRVYVILITIFFLITGLIVLQLLNESSLDDPNVDLSGEMKENETKANQLKIFLKEYKETYYGKRKAQIITLIIINIITSVLQGVYCLVKNFWLMEDGFTFKKNTVIPFTVLSMLAYTLYISSCLLSVIGNYVSFFWVIRVEFLKKRVKPQSISLSESEIKQDSNIEDAITEENKIEEIKSYFKKSSSIKSDLAHFELE